MARQQIWTHLVGSNNRCTASDQLSSDRLLIELFNDSLFKNFRWLFSWCNFRDASVVCGRNFAGQVSWLWAHFQQILNLNLMAFSNRGALGEVFIVMVAVGLLLGYCVGPFFHYNTCVWGYMILPVVFLIGSIFIRESPFYLILKGKDEVTKQLVTS